MQALAKIAERLRLDPSESESQNEDISAGVIWPRPGTGTPCGHEWRPGGDDEVGQAVPHLVGLARENLRIITILYFPRWPRRTGKGGATNCRALSRTRALKLE